MIKRASLLVGMSFLLFSHTVFALQAAVWNRYSGFDYSQRIVQDDVSSAFQCAMQKSGYQVNLSLIPLNRQIKMMQKGLLDIGVAWVQSKKHDSVGVMTKPVSSIELVLLTSKPFSYDYFFNEIKLATTMEAGVVEMIEGLRADPEYVKTFSSAALMALHDRVDGAIVPEPSLALLEDALRSDLYRTELGDIPLLFYVSKQSHEFEVVRAALNKGIDYCLADSKQL